MSDRRRQQKAKRSAQFDTQCFGFATAFVEFQAERLRDAVSEYRDPERSVFVPDQKSMGQMAASVRNAQAIGKLALGEAQSSEKKQLDLDLGEQTRNLSYDELIKRLQGIATQEPMRAILADALGPAAIKAL